MYQILLYFMYFLIYSFFGYIIEIIVCSWYEKKVVNRGFMYGPICPIYGVGALLIIFGLSSFYDNPVLLFILGMLITAIIEYYTSYLFEKIFNNKWWDYSDRKDSINGRICLGNCLFFGIGSLLLIRVFHPIVIVLINKIPYSLFIIISVVLFIIFVFDLISSIIIAYNLRSKIIVAEELKKEKLQMLPSRFEKKYHDQIVKIKSMKNRLIRIYPNITKNIQKEFKIVSYLVKKEHEKNVKKSKKEE